MTQGSDIAAVQSAEKHQEAGAEESGLGGFFDFSKTISEGLKWLLTLPEGAVAAYAHIISSLIDSGILATMFGKSGNMLGIKLLEGLAEFFSGGGEGGAPQDEGGEGHDSGNFPHLDDQMGHDWSGFAGGAHHDHDYHQGPSFSPGSSPSVGDDHEPALGA